MEPRAHPSAFAGDIGQTGLAQTIKTDGALVLTDPQPIAAVPAGASSAPIDDLPPEAATFDALLAAGPPAGPASPLTSSATRPARSAPVAPLAPPSVASASPIGLVATLSREGRPAAVKYAAIPTLGSAPCALDVLALRLPGSPALRPLPAFRPGLGSQ